MVKNSSKIGTAVSYEMENQIKELVSAGKYISTSHFIREAIKLLLKKELKDNKTIIFKALSLQWPLKRFHHKYIQIPLIIFVLFLSYYFFIARKMFKKYFEKIVDVHNFQLEHLFEL